MPRRSNLLRWDTWLGARGAKNVANEPISAGRSDFLGVDSIEQKQSETGPQRLFSSPAIQIPSFYRRKEVKTASSSGGAIRLW